MFNKLTTKNRHRQLQYRSGFSLMEMMIVLLIIAMMAGMVAFNMSGFLTAGRVDGAKADLNTLHEAVLLYEATFGNYPTNESGLEALVAPNPKFPNGLLKQKSVPKDPWGNPYQYNAPGQTGPFEIICFGADGESGGENENQDLSSETLLQ